MLAPRSRVNRQHVTSSQFTIEPFDIEQRKTRRIKTTYCGRRSVLTDPKRVGSTSGHEYTSPSAAHLAQPPRLGAWFTAPCFMDGMRWVEVRDRVDPKSRLASPAFFLLDLANFLKMLDVFLGDPWKIH